jgi:hypothetical protein
MPRSSCSPASRSQWARWRLPVNEFGFAVAVDVGPVQVVVLRVERVDRVFVPGRRTVRMTALFPPVEAVAVRSADDEIRHAVSVHVGDDDRARRVPPTKVERFDVPPFVFERVAVAPRAIPPCYGENYTPTASVTCFTALRKTASPAPSAGKGLLRVQA